ACAPTLRATVTVLAALLLAACPGKPPEPDAGPADSGPAPPPSCSTPADCKAQGFDGVCRSGVCNSDVPCLDDVECSLAESCRAGRCVFTGCTANSDCKSGDCKKATFECTECGANKDCPRNRPVCEVPP